VQGEGKCRNRGSLLVRIIRIKIIIKLKSKKKKKEKNQVHLSNHVIEELEGHIILAQCNVLGRDRKLPINSLFRV